MELSLSESMVDPGYSVGYAPAGKASVMYVPLSIDIEYVCSVY